MDDVPTRQPSHTEQTRMQPGEGFAGRYTIAQLIGEGGMGVVYRATDKLTEKEVALKLIRADRLAGTDAVKRLIREGVTSRDIRHPNVVAVYDVGESNGQPYMSMEFLAGKSLRAWNRERMQGPDCSMATAASIIREILAGLEAAHRAGVIHRDLKPENVMLLSEPSDAGVQLKLLDFGIARAPNSGDTGATSLGTRGYMAPEQLTAPDAAQASADLFSLSVMFYELLVGVVPQNYWQPPSGGRADVPIAIDQLIQKGLSPSPRTRPQAVAEYREALEAAMKQPAPSAAIGTWADRPEVKDALKKTTDFFNKGGLIGHLAEKAKTDAGQTPRPHAGPTPTPRDMKLWNWFMYAVTKRYTDGKGRAHRKEYWGFNVGAFALVFAAAFVDAAGASGGGYADAFGNYYAPEVTPIAATLVWLALLPPSIAVASRRMHDLGYSGWLAATMAIPFIGWIIAILMGLSRGAPGENAYGPDPLAPAGGAG
jgi:serine/threonine protein kinase